MKQPAHLITLEPWNNASLGVRVACEMGSMMLWPLQPDDRLTVLISLLAHHIGNVGSTEDEIDAIADIFRMRLKMIRQESPSIQPH